MRRFVPAAFLVLLMTVLALRFAQPILDGDIFWHMASAQQMLDRGTLRPDQSVYSWMTASNEIVYCAWLGQLLFLKAWKAFGIAGLFGLRYAAILTVLALLGLYAWRRGMLTSAVTWVVLLITMLASVAAMFPKPEMLSLVLWHAVLFCYFRALWAVEQGANPVPYIWAIPAIMLVWVNTHGAFMLAAPFFAITGIGAWFMFSRPIAVQVTASWALCGLLTAATPYGLSYPLELVNYALGRLPHRDLAWNNAFQPTFAAGGWFLHLPEFLIFMTAGLAAALWRKSRSGIFVAALFAAYVPFYLLYVRSTFLLPGIFAYAFLWLAPTVRWVPAFATLFLFWGGRAVYETRYRPEPGSWMGFGIADSQPVAEAEFLEAGNFGPRIYNTYNTGSYLLWRLYPRYKVMVDARSFPYLGWFDELVRFQRTENPAEFQAFLTRHPADVAVIDFDESQAWSSFLKMPGWRPVFYGPSAAVFAKSDAPLRAAASLAHLRNSSTAAKVFDFAVATGDYRTAWIVLDRMQGPLRRSAELYRAGHAALACRRLRSRQRFFPKGIRTPRHRRSRQCAVIAAARRDWSA